MRQWKEIVDIYCLPTDRALEHLIHHDLRLHDHNLLQAYLHFFENRQEVWFGLLDVGH